MIYQQRDHKWIYLFEEGRTEKALLSDTLVTGWPH